MRLPSLFAIVLVTVSIAACGGDAPPPADGGIDASRACATDRECDDGLYCTGVESCVGGHCLATPRPCGTAQTCVEPARRCITLCATSEDADGDGARAVECGGTDCDDSDPDRYPGNTEVCDTLRHDEDCDTSTYGFRDADHDDYPDATCCNVDADGNMHCGNDCDDNMPGMHPALAEVCNGLDEDCDGLIDEAILIHAFVDADHDGHGVAGTGMDVCAIEPGLARSSDDCDDVDAMRFPGNPEVCDAMMIDEDCSGVGNDVPGGCDCTGTGTAVCGTVGRCTGATHMCDAGHWTPCTIVPTTEVCDRLTDEDCDGMIDEGLTRSCYRDRDGDGYASDAAAAEVVCRDMTAGRAGAPWSGCPSGYTARAPGAGTVDCCDSDGRAHPGAGAQTARSACGTFDFDCDGHETIAEVTTVLTCRSSHSDMASCNADLTRGWCGPVPACGAMQGLSAHGCWFQGACYPSECWPTAMPCR